VDAIVIFIGLVAVAVAWFVFRKPGRSAAIERSPPLKKLPGNEKAKEDPPSPVPVSKIATEGDFVVVQLMDDAILTDHVLRGCIDTIANTNDLDRQMIIGFVHYVFARPIGMSECSKTDADHILGALLDVLMTTAPELDYAETKNAIPAMYRLLSAGDTATIHIRVSTAAFLQAMKNGGSKITDDDNKLRLMLHVVESLQVEVRIFLNTVLERYVLAWTKHTGELTETRRRQAADIVGLRKLIREESDRIQGARDTADQGGRP
jgi:hypothetical protein